MLLYDRSEAGPDNLIEIVFEKKSELVSIVVQDKEDWDFKGVDTQYMTHGLHPYPARMIPQIARRLLKRYGKPNKLALDPFCGSGTVLVESRLLGMNSVGIDINPLAKLLAEVKSTPIDPKILRKNWKKLENEISEDIFELKFYGKLNAEIPDFSGTNIKYWFKPNTIKELAILRKHIFSIEEELIRKFFLVPFSLTVREASGIRRGEFKLYRIPKQEWERYNPEVFRIFIKNVKKSIEKMALFYKKSFKEVFSKVYLADTRKIFSNEFPEEGNRDLKENPPIVIVTSPPYGDSRTTVAYGQFSRYSSIWLGFPKELVMKVDKLSLGGDKNSAKPVDSPLLMETIELIKKRDEKRAIETLAFFSDLFKCIEKLYEVLDDGGHCCIVIANRTVKRVLVPTDVIIAEMGALAGFNEKVRIIPREIPTKRLPWLNAPENIPGYKGRTMSKESIVILKKG